MIERTIYECEHCHKKRLINQTQMKKHEDICWYNSKNKTCVTCSHYEYEHESIEIHTELESCPKEIIPAFKYCELEEKTLEGTPIINCKNWKEREEL